MHSLPKGISKKSRRRMMKKIKLKALVEISQLNANSNEKGIPLKRKTNQEDGVPLNKNDCHEPKRKRLKNNVQYPLNGQEVTTEVPPIFGELTENQQRHLKKLLEQRSKLRLDRPFLELNEIGKAADLTTPTEKRVPLTIDDFQNLIITCMHGNTNPRWIELKRPINMKHKIFVVIEGAGLKEYIENETNLPTLREFETKVEFITPVSYGGSLMDELALLPLSKSYQRKLSEEYGSLYKAMKEGEVCKSMKTVFQIKPKKNVPNTSQDRFSRQLLLLSPYEMIEENFPFPLSGKLGSEYKDYVFTKDEYDEVTDNSPIWSLDCEMCLTSKGSELTRLCIVNEKHEIMYETLVKPYNKIRNYLTQYSGITKQMLQGVETRLEDVQQYIRKICPPDVIFVGHSLNVDLKALKMIHPYVIDTSIIFNLSGVRQRKSKLRVLTEEFLSEKIQTDKHGHNPIEDALAAMKLVQVKLQHSVSWGNAVLSGPRSSEESEAARVLLQAREEVGEARLTGSVDYSHLISDKKQTRLTTSLISRIVLYNKNVLLVGKESLMDSWSRYFKPSELVKQIVAPTEKAAVKIARTVTPNGGITILHISLSSRTPDNAIVKADKLIGKLFRQHLPNVLYAIFLSGHPNRPGNGLMFLHLLREHIPFARLPSDS